MSMTAAGVSYVLAESTRTLSLTYPHTHEPGDQLFLGGGSATSSINGLCEHTCSLLPPDPESNLPYLLEIPDLSVHPKYNNVGYVRGWPHAKFYCGAPMRTKNGVTIGTICIMDERPRYKGLTSVERAKMHDLSELFMKYLETKQGEEQRNKTQMMEMELSRFIAEGYLPGEGALMIEKRDGRLWSAEALERRRMKEAERRKKVEERRQLLQEQEYAAMVRRENEKLLQRERALTDGHQDQSDGQHEGSVCSETSEEEQVHPSQLVPVVKECQPGLITMMTAAEMSKKEAWSFAQQEVIRPRLSLLRVEEETEDLQIPKAHSSSANGIRPKISPLGTTEKSLSSGSSSVALDRDSNAASTTNETSIMGGSQSSGQRRLSKYEQTMAMEPQLRQMFARAAELIRSTIGADVLFVDSDLEGLFEPSPQNDVHGEKDGSWSFVSSDPNMESAVRARRPAAHRAVSGVLGYATAQGNSKHISFDNSRSVDLGFDVSQLTEEDLQHLARDNTGGKLVAFVDKYPGLEEDPHGLDFTEEILKKALPGCKSAVILPLHNHHGKLFSILFAWTRKSDRTFVTEVEGKFVQGVGESIMGQITRLHILAGTSESWPLPCMIPC